MNKSKCITQHINFSLFTYLNTSIPQKKKKMKQKIAILGFGIEGRAIAKYFKGHMRFPNITVCDQNENIEIPAGVKSQLGHHYLQDIQGFDLIFRSPGISCLKREIIQARKRGQTVTSLTQYFFDHCPGKIIGVTGTKGKGTTATLIAKILSAAGFDTHLGGNIGDPPLNFLDKLRPTSWTVLELSSFQLQDLTRSPHIAVVLNVTQEHLDYHRSTKEYREAKNAMVVYQKKTDFVIVNEDYRTSQHYATKTPAKQFTISRKGKVRQGAYFKNGKIFFNNTVIMTASEAGLLGAFNLENILPAVTVAGILKINPSMIKKVVKEFRGLPHRLEWVGEKDGVNYYNDSFSTTPETTMAAIGAFKTPLILIVGGSEKHSNFLKLAQTVIHARHIKKVIFLGNQAAKRLKREIQKAKKLKSFRDAPLIFSDAMSMQEALLSAKRDAMPGDTVLLSPACASFDLFKNYKERGDIFRNLVKEC